MSTQEMDSITKKVLARLAEMPVVDEQVYEEELRYCSGEEHQPHRQAAGPAQASRHPYRRRGAGGLRGRPRSGGAQVLGVTS